MSSSSDSVDLDLSFNIVSLDQLPSYSFTCSGDCDIFDTFPGVTCSRAANGTRTCSNSVVVAAGAKLDFAASTTIRASNSSFTHFVDVELQGCSMSFDGDQSTSHNLTTRSDTCTSGASPSFGWVRSPRTSSPLSATLVALLIFTSLFTGAIAAPNLDEKLPTRSSPAYLPLGGVVAAPVEHVVYPLERRQSAPKFLHYASEAVEAVRDYLFEVEDRIIWNSDDEAWFEETVMKEFTDFICKAAVQFGMDLLGTKKTCGEFMKACLTGVGYAVARWSQMRPVSARFNAAFMLGGDTICAFIAYETYKNSPDRADYQVKEVLCPHIVDLIPGEGEGGEGGERDCGDLTANWYHCGSCDNTCKVDQTCVDSNCVSDCGDITTDPNNCGWCGNKCDPGQVCADSSCVIEGLGGQPWCTNTDSDPNNCGFCGNQCPAGQTCVNSDCVSPSDEPSTTTTPSTGPTATPGAGTVGCGDTTSDVKNCGTCGHECPQGQTCVDSECADGSDDGGDDGTHRPWILRYEDQDGGTIWQETPAHLATLGGNYLVEGSSGKPTVNTGCVPISAGGDESASSFPSGTDFYFGYDDEDLLSAVDYDTCCLYLYDNTECSGGEDGSFSGGCHVMFGEVTIEVSAFKVTGCTMLLQK